MLNIVKNQLIGQSNKFKKKLVLDTNILHTLSRFLTEYQKNNPYIVKEAATIMNSLLTFMDTTPDQESLAKDKQGKPKMEVWRNKIKSDSQVVAAMLMLP